MRRIRVFLIVLLAAIILILCVDVPGEAQQSEPIHPRQLDRLGAEGKLDELLTSAQEFIKIRREQDRWMAYKRLFRGFLMHDRLTDLIPTFQETVQKHPDDPDAYKMLGQIYRLQGDMTKAITMYEKVVELSPEDYLAHQQLGMFYSSCGSYEKSISSYRKALGIKPDREESYYRTLWYNKAHSYREICAQLADVYIATGQRDAAISMYEKMLDVEPIDIRLLAAIYSRPEMKEDVGKFASVLKQRAGNSAYLNTLLGDFYLAIDQQEEQIKALEEAVRLTPRRRYLEMLKRAYERAGKYDLATQTQERIKSPDRPAGTGTIFGTVSDAYPEGNPVANARVQYEARGVKAEVTTDEVGDFVIAGLRPGEYILRVSKTGYAKPVYEYVTAAAGAHAYMDFKMWKEDPSAPRTTTPLDIAWSGFAVLRIHSSGEMSVDGRAVATLDDWERFLTVNGPRIETLIIKADRDIKWGVVNDAMNRVRRARRALIPPTMFVQFHISVIKQEPARAIEVSLPSGRSSVKQIDSIIRVGNPESPGQFGVVILNDWLINMVLLRDRLKNRPEGWTDILIIQSSPDVPHEQIYQIADAANRAGIKRIEFSAVIPETASMIPVRRGHPPSPGQRVRVTARVPLQRKTEKSGSPAQEIYDAGMALVLMPNSEAKMKQAKENAPKAIPYFNEVIEKFPDTDYADLSYIQLGLCYEYLEQWKNAEKYYGDLVARYTDQDGNPITPSSQNVIQAVAFARQRKGKIMAYRLSIMTKEQSKRGK